MAIGALKRGEVHVAGVHLVDDRSGAWNLPSVKRQSHEHGLFCCHLCALGREHDPKGKETLKKIRSVSDLAHQRESLIGKSARGHAAFSINNLRLAALRLRASKDTPMRSRPILKWHQGLEPGWPIPVSECRRQHQFAVSISFRCSASATTWSFPRATTKRCKD